MWLTHNYLFCYSNIIPLRVTKVQLLNTSSQEIIQIIKEQNTTNQEIQQFLFSLDASVEFFLPAETVHRIRSTRRVCPQVENRGMASRE
jgi:hypothetical protein